METVKITSHKDTGKKFQDKPIFTVELGDARTCKFFGEWPETLKDGSEVAVEIKEGKEYNGHKDLILNLSKPKDGKGFAPKDWKYEKRKTSLECSVELGKASGVKAVDILKVAEVFYDYLNKQ